MNSSDDRSSPHTRHVHDDGTPRFTNRLVKEDSPYLRQHAHNPVAWFPWGDEAFTLAEKTRRPILLSVGYSTCHWCHVMEEESFEDEAIAKLINDNYVPIKVDREERPDIDAVYMAAVQAMSGRGGWPMTVWLTPDKRPYYGGTYFPPYDGDRGARTGFATMLTELRRLYDEQPERVESAARDLTEAVRQQLREDFGATNSEDTKNIKFPAASLLGRAVHTYALSFDESEGGLGQAPKFPSSVPVRLLLKLFRRPIGLQQVEHGPKALQMSLLTLDKMAGGGIYDHVAGGFHRYSVDNKWLVPHFEKMLYDNALLATAYLDAFQLTQNPHYAAVVRDILNYLQKDMSDPSGGFYSATDADSEHPDRLGKSAEGYFFTWTPEELAAAFGAQDAGVICQIYQVEDGGNFEGRSILHRPEPLPSIAAKTGKTVAALQALIDRARPVLESLRKQRPRPLRDEKILSGWNGLAISAFAQAGFVLSEPQYIERAEKAAEFILTVMMQKEREGTTPSLLLRTCKDQKARIPAYLEDYAYLIQALLDLHETSKKPHWLSNAAALQKTADLLFGDSQEGGYFSTSTLAHEKLLVREKPSYDGATPSGNSVMAMNLLRLDVLSTSSDYEVDSKLEKNNSYRKNAEKLFSAFAQSLHRAPTAMAEMLSALHFYYDTSQEIVLTGDNPSIEPFLEVLRTIYVPNKSITVHRQTHNEEKSGTVSVCHAHVCQLPTSDPEVFKKQISADLQAYT